MLVATKTTALLEDEWLEAFWCDECQETKWYHVKKVDVSNIQAKSVCISYKVSVASRSDWQQSISAIQASEFSLWRYPQESNQLSNTK